MDNTTHCATRGRPTYKLPPGYTASMLCYAMQHAREHPDAVYVSPDGIRRDAAAYRRWFLGCLHRKINRNRKPYGRNDGGDGYQSDAERWTRQTARQVNTPRLIVRESEVPYRLRKRLAHRLHAVGDF